jgi:hypothetical protein
MSDRGATLEKEMVRFAAKVASHIDDVVGEMRDIVDEASADGASPPADFAYFLDATRQLLVERGSGDVLAGAGYAVSYLDYDRAPAMVWWVHHAGQVVERSHSVDPESESFYDYASLRWFRLAVESRCPTLSGPFIDTWGSDDYTVTVSVPVVGASGPLGVFAADVDVRRLIDTLTADLRRIGSPVALVNEADRVVVSTIPLLSTGLPMQTRALRHDSVARVRLRVPVPGYSWSVVALTD